MFIHICVPLLHSELCNVLAFAVKLVTSDFVLLKITGENLFLVTLFVTVKMYHLFLGRPV